MKSMIMQKTKNTYINKNRFVIFCNELFTIKTSFPSEEVYRILSKNGVVKELINGYEDLHGMSTSFLNQYISGLSGIKESYSNKQDHSLAKFLIFTDVVEMIFREYRVSLDDARERFYASEIIKFFSDDELGLYGDSPNYIFSLYKKEQIRKELN